MVRFSARTRLAFLYTGLVLGAGAALAALTYLLVRRSLDDRPRMIGTTGSPALPSRDSAAALAEIDRLRADTLNQLLTQSMLALAVVALLAAGLGWLVAGRVLRPIRTISATARRLSAEHLSERMPVTAPADELATLAETINGMLDRIQSSIADRDRLLHNRRMFAANAAHELRTPLTTIRTAIDVTLDGRPSADELAVMASDIRDAVEHSQRTLDGLLTLARSHAGSSSQHEIDLADLVAQVVATLRVHATTRDVELRTHLRPTPVTGDLVLLDRMATNLLDNAIRHNEAGGHVVITTGSAQNPHLRVTNTGQHIEPGDVDRLFEPFVLGATNPRTDTGVGLGLSIVRAVVDAHHGQLTAAPRPSGGMEITVHLPPHSQLTDLR